jgi:hypothetical protein
VSKLFEDFMSAFGVTVYLVGVVAYFFFNGGIKALGVMVTSAFVVALYHKH